MATKNGSKFLKEQLDSILIQLSPEDEVIISDDASTDNTVSIIESFHDPRIKIIRNTQSIGIVANFESGLNACSHEFIFLADQDDVWVAGKVEKTLQHLADADLVLSDCQMVDYQLNPIKDSFFSDNNSRKGLVKNLIRNSYMGCCMAFKRKLLDRALPFPKDIPMHDLWLGLVAEVHFKIHFTNEALVLHRRHQYNASTTGMSSELPIRKQFLNRYKILKNLILHKAYAG